MLTTMVIDAMMTAFISMFCVFVTAPHFCGAYFLCQGRCPLSPAGGDSTRTVVFVEERHKNEYFSTQTGVFVDKNL